MLQTPTIMSYHALWSFAFLYICRSRFYAQKQGLKILVMGGSQIVFERGVLLEPRNPFPFLRGILAEKVTHFIRTFLETLAHFSNFLGVLHGEHPKIGPIIRNFMWKSDPLEWHIPVNLKYPSPDLSCVKYKPFSFMTNGCCLHNIFVISKFVSGSWRGTDVYGSNCMHRNLES